MVGGLLVLRWKPENWKTSFTTGQSLVFGRVTRPQLECSYWSILMQSGAVQHAVPHAVYVTGNVLL